MFRYIYKVIDIAMDERNRATSAWSSMDPLKRDALRSPNAVTSQTTRRKQHYQQKESNEKQRAGEREKCEPPKNGKDG